MGRRSRYGQVETPLQGEIIHGLGVPQLAMQAGVSELAKAVVREMLGLGVGAPAGHDCTA